MFDPQMPEFVRDPRRTLSITVPNGCILDLHEQPEIVPYVQTVSEADWVAKVQEYTDDFDRGALHRLVQWGDFSGDQLGLVQLDRRPHSTDLSFLPHGEDFRAAVFVRPDMNVCVQVLDRGMLQLQNIHGADVEAHIGWGAALHSNASKSVCRVSGPNGRQAAHGVTEGTGVLRYLGVKVSASSRFIEYWNEPKPEIDDPAVIRAIVLPLAAGGLNPPGRRRGDFGDPFL